MNAWLTLGEFLSNAGTGIGFSALGLALAVRGEAWALAALAALSYLVQPLALYTGLVIDRTSPRKLLVAGKPAEGGAWIALAFLPAHPELAVGLAFVAVVSHDLAYDALNAALIRGYRTSLLAETGRFQNAWLSGNLAGTLAGPALYAALGSVSFLPASLLLVAGGLVAAAWRPPPAVEPEPRSREGLFQGFAWVVQQPLLRAFVLIGFLAVLALSLGRALVPMIALALGVPEPALGLYLGAATVGSLAANLVGPQPGAAPSVWLGTALGAIGSLALILTPYPLALGTTGLRVGGFTLGLLGLRVFRQWLLPRALAGRGTAAMSILNGMAGVAGAALAAAFGGNRPLLTLLASGLLLAAVLFLLVLWVPPRRLRELEACLAREEAV